MGEAILDSPHRNDRCLGRVIAEFFFRARNSSKEKVVVKDPQMLDVGKDSVAIGNIGGTVVDY